MLNTPGCSGYKQHLGPSASHCRCNLLTHFYLTEYSVRLTIHLEARVKSVKGLLLQVLGITMMWSFCYSKYTNNIKKVLSAVKFHPCFLTKNSSSFKLWGKQNASKKHRIVCIWGKKIFLFNTWNQPTIHGYFAQKGSFAMTRIRKEHPNTCQQLDFYPNLMQNASKCIWKYILMLISTNVNIKDLLYGDKRSCRMFDKEEMQ